MLCAHNCQRRIPNCVEISTKSLSKRENSAAIFLVFLRVNPIAQRAYYRFCTVVTDFCTFVTDFCAVVTDFCAVLQIFALFWVMYGIDCTRINQSQPRNISLCIISNIINSRLFTPSVQNISACVKNAAGALFFNTLFAVLYADNKSFLIYYILLRNLIHIVVNFDKQQPEKLRTYRHGLAPIEGPCHSSTERSPEIFCCPECFR